MLLVGLLAGCGSGADSTSTDGSSAPPDASDGPDASDAPSAAESAEPSGPAERVETVVDLDAVVLTVSAADPARVDAQETTAAIVADVGPGAPAQVATADGRTLEVNVDGTVTVRDDGGTPVGGLTAPSDGGRFEQADPTHVDLVVGSTTSPTSPTSPATASSELSTTETTLGVAAVAATDWGDREGGRSLAVTPTDWARTAGVAGEDLVLAELVAGEPDVDSATMRDQLTCHMVGAPDKATWNLEPWRPDVGLLAVLAARCNPTAQD